MATPIDVTPANELELVIGRIIDAPRHAVWRCWTEEALLKQWYCPKPWTVPEADLDVRPGGRFNTVFAGPDGERHDNKGIWLEIESEARLVFTDAFTEGYIPQPDSFMTGYVELSDADDGKTRFIWGALHPTAEKSKQHAEMGFEQGWGAAAEQLEEVARSVAGEAIADHKAHPMTPVDRSSLPDGLHPLSPHLIVNDAAGAIDFYKAAFGADEMVRLPREDGKLIHACVSINGSSVMLVDEFPDHGGTCPKRLKGTPVSIHLMVQDVDAAFDQAIMAGATVVTPVQEMFWGDRFGEIEDPFGHRWSIATPTASKTPDEILRDMKSM